VLIENKPDKKQRKEKGKKALMFKYCLSFEIKSLLVTGSQLVNHGFLLYPGLIWRKQPALPH
jgi:hypothetical protein